MPDKVQSEENLTWLRKVHRFEIDNESVYQAPLYEKEGPIKDEKLLSMIESKEYNYIFIQLGGGVQERLGLYLRQNLSYKPTILCTGAALAFLSGVQIRIPNWADKYYLGWLLRCFSNPKSFYSEIFRCFSINIFTFKARKEITSLKILQMEVDLEKENKSVKLKASVQVLGCRLNQYEGTSLEGKLREAGYEIVPFGEQADLGVINTCTVTNQADAKSRSAIRRFSRKNPTSITVVVGCYSQTSANEVAMVDGVDYIIGNHDKMNFLNYLTDVKP